MSIDKQYPDNRQKTPERERPISGLATEMFNNVDRPLYYKGVENMQRIIETVVVPEAFNQTRQSQTVDTLGYGAMSNTLEGQNA